MDVAEFQEWSGGIARLSRAQRRQTFQTLALSEASDSYDDDLGECREADAVTAVSGDTLGDLPPLWRTPQQARYSPSGGDEWQAVDGRSRMSSRRRLCGWSRSRATQ